MEHEQSKLVKHYNKYLERKFKYLFSKTYWGAQDGAKIDPIIKSNRIKFIEQFHLKKPFIIKDIHWRNDDNYHFFDHLESYINNKKQIIVLVSPYNPTEKIIAKYHAYGFREVGTLYHPRARSFVALFFNTQQFFDVLERAGAGCSLRKALGMPPFEDHAPGRKGSLRFLIEE